MLVNIDSERTAAKKNFIVQSFVASRALCKTRVSVARGAEIRALVLSLSVAG
jgi:hypothetical protein